MATVILKENTIQKASTMAPPSGIKSIEEMIFIPAISNNLETDSDKTSQEIWVLDKKRYQVFKDEASKYDDVAKQLEKAKINLGQAKDESSIKTATLEVEKVQKQMREVLAQGMGLNEDTLTPLPKDSDKKIVECYGYVSKRTFYVSALDIKKVSDAKTKGKQKFRFAVTLLEPTGKHKYTYKLENYITDSNDGKSTEQQRELENSKEKNKTNAITQAYDKLKADLNKEYKLLDDSGQLKSKYLAKCIAPSIAAFLTGEDYDIIDAKIKMFNDTAQFSYQQYEKKQEEIISYLKLGFNNSKEGFSHYHWGKIHLLIHEIWRDSESNFPLEFKNQFPAIPYDKNLRKSIIEYIKKEPLPSVAYDYGGGAQFMRYASNVGGKVNFDFSKGVASASFDAKTKLALAQAGAEFNRYFPNDKGTNLEFKATVKEEYFTPKLLGTGNNYTQGITPLYAHNSSFPMPLTLLNIARQLSNIKNESLGFKDLTQEIVIQVAGHTDTTGDNAYNNNMGYRRANAVHAFFTNNNIDWLELFNKGIWKDEERDLMELSIFMLENHNTNTFNKVMNNEITDNGDFNSNLLEKIRLAVNQYNYPISNIRSNKILKQIQATPLEGNFTKNIKINSKTSDEDLINRYRIYTKKYVLQEVTDLTLNDFRRFYIDTEAHPILTHGEERLNSPLLGRIAVNRTVTLNMWGVVRNKKEVEKDIVFGEARVKIHGQLTGFVGANIALSGALELNTYKGITHVVAKQKKEDVVAVYQGDQIVPSNDTHKHNPTATVKAFDPNAKVEGQAFVGAKAEASLSAKLEWKKPEKTEDFKLLASIGGLVSGSAGVGIEGEFKIGFDRRSNTFQIKMKASATWGLGGGGAWSLSIGVEELFDFTVLVYHKLEDNDFNFIDIFEKVINKDGTTTESRIDVFQLYEAWVLELWNNKDYTKLGVAALTGTSAVAAINLLNNIDKLFIKYKKYKRNQQATKNLVNNVFADKKHNTLRFAPPRVKGRMLYQITEHKYWESSDILDTDLYKNCEKAAITIIKTINHGREWQEVLEHLSIKTQEGNSYKAFDDNSKKEDPGNWIRIQESTQFLRLLLNDTEDWNTVCHHINSLPHLNEAWKLKN
ncbi:OmpA family protein [Pseudotamlana agarivorans]|uniref:OmpA family protein n=1 Tax=Pseudotamlana agarivorans TaxID=481183 RepID=UPI00082FBBBA|nr:OmpA family protein [Tamlana agarivorans]